MIQAVVDGRGLAGGHGGGQVVADVGQTPHQALSGPAAHRLEKIALGGIDRPNNDQNRQQGRAENRQPTQHGAAEWTSGRLSAARRRLDVDPHNPYCGLFQGGGKGETEKGEEGRNVCGPSHREQACATTPYIRRPARRFPLPPSAFPLPLSPLRGRRPPPPHAPPRLASTSWRLRYRWPPWSTRRRPKGRGHLGPHRGDGYGRPPACSQPGVTAVSGLAAMCYGV